MSKNPTLYTDQILENITNIYDDINGKDLQSFRADRRVRQLVERNLEILWEICRKDVRNLEDAVKRICQMFK